MYDYETCSESVLVKRARKKDIKAFSKLYEYVYKDLYCFALYMLKNPQDAEDAVSDVVLAAYRSIGKLRNEEAFRSWIFKILTNTCKKRLSAKSRQEAVTSHKEIGENEKASEVNYEENIDVQNAWKVLTEEEQQIVALSVFGGYNSREIGELLGEGGNPVNANTVRSKRSRALEKLGKMLK